MTLAFISCYIIHLNIRIKQSVNHEITTIDYENISVTVLIGFHGHIQIIAL